MHQHTQGRTSFVKAVRENAHRIFDSYDHIPAATWKNEERGKIPALKKLLSWNPDSKKVDRCPPLVYRGLKKSSVGMFRHSALIKVCISY